MLDKNRITLEAELLGQAHRLTLTVLEKLRRFHLGEKYTLNSIDVNVPRHLPPPALGTKASAGDVPKVPKAWEL